MYRIRSTCIDYYENIGPPGLKANDAAFTSTEVSALRAFSNKLTGF